MSGSVVGGYESHNSDRSVFDNLEGDGTADGSYHSFYISPSLSLAWSHDLGDGFEFRPSARAAYTYGHYSGYTESGTANSDLRFDGRDVHIFDSRLQLALAQSFTEDRGELEVRGGATFTHYGDDNAGVSLGGGDSISYRVPGDETIPAGYVGASLRYAVRKTINLVSDVEYHNGTGGTESISGYLGLRVRF